MEIKIWSRRPGGRSVRVLFAVFPLLSLCSADMGRRRLGSPDRTPQCCAVGDKDSSSKAEKWLLLLSARAVVEAATITLRAACSGKKIKDNILLNIVMCVVCIVLCRKGAIYDSSL